MRASPCFSWLAALTIGVTGGLLALARPAGGQMKPRAKIELKIATIAPEGSTWMRTMDQLDAEIRQKTNGEVGLKFYPGGIQGDDSHVLSKIRLGALHGGGFTGVGLGEIASALRVMEVPFLFHNDAEVRGVMQKMEPTFDQMLHDAGWELLGWSDVGFVYLFSKQPIASAADLKRIKMWLWEGDPLAETFLKTLGVSPVPLPITDVVTSLQTGLIDAVYTSPTACIALQWFTRVSDMTDIPVTHAMGAVVVTSKAFAQLSPDAQATVHDLCKKYFAQLAEATARENAESMDVLKQKGIKFVTLNAADQAGLEEIGKTVQGQLVGRLYSQPLLDQVLQALNEVRAGGAGGSQGSDGRGAGAPGGK